MSPAQTCTHCGASSDKTRLEICPMCHKRACQEHLFRRGGKAFCTERCAIDFFFGHDEDEDGDGGEEEG